MKPVFISYVEEDSAAALSIAQGLEAAGLACWYYERDSIPGYSYLDQVLRSIEEATSVVVVLSDKTVASSQVHSELVRAHEQGKQIVPVLIGLTHAELKRRRPEWGLIIGDGTSVVAPPQIEQLVPRLVAGIRAAQDRAAGRTPPAWGGPSVVDQSTTGGGTAGSSTPGAAPPPVTPPPPPPEAPPITPRVEPPATPVTPRVEPAPPRPGDVQPPAVAPAPPMTSRDIAAIASLVVGVIALCAWILPICGAPLSFAGIVAGVAGIGSRRQGFGIGGIVLNVVGLGASVVNAVFGIILALSGNPS